MSADFTDRAPLLHDPQPLHAHRPVPPDPWPMVPTALVFVFAIFLLISILLFACRRFANTNASPPSTWQRNQHVPPPPLCPDAVAALPLVRAGAGNELSCCAVCLAEHEEGETLKLMPACGHVFHPECIDTWLLSHGTCPVCRCSELSGSRTTREVRVDVFETEGEGDEREEQRSDLLRAIGRSRSCCSRVEVEGTGFAMVFLRRSCSF